MVHTQRKTPVWVVVAIVLFAASIGTFGASVTVGSAEVIVDDFTTTQKQRPFLISAYLIGCAIGPLLFGPMSERYGRKVAMISGSALTAIFTCAAVGAPNWAALLIFRFLAGLGSTAPMLVASGIIVDILPSPAVRGLINCWLMVSTTLGPLIASICSIFLHNRWPRQWNIPFWINGGAVFLACLTMFLLPETLKDAKIAGSPEASESLGSPESLEKPRRSRLTQIVLPFRMIALEPIVSVTCVFLSLMYSILYLFFQLLPVLFNEYYSFGKNAEAVVFVPIAVGSVIAGLIYTFLEPALQKLVESEKYGKGRGPELRRLPPSCVGSVFCVASLVLAGYSVSNRAHYAYLLVLEGVFGVGFLLIFMGLTNYLVDAYKTAVVSALVPSFTIRNLAGAGFQFAAGPLYSNLGAKWELYLLGFLSLPFACLIIGTLWYGPWLRAHSKIVQSMTANRTDMERAVVATALDVTIVSHSGAIGSPPTHRMP